ncbi:hypothetical protein AAE02nite_06650 [Adhaeribacter aerolatus]|uniref:Uncharacterized protein n=1 Tax=Adhaeribacter aerolatus TaxID=670289 RepID=A0A512ATF2_9BACT|nr:hypothetical protein AAE02nite_06650 [Adhaeribacter aerolatus]
MFIGKEPSNINAHQPLMSVKCYKSDEYLRFSSYNIVKYFNKYLFYSKLLNNIFGLLTKFINIFHHPRLFTNIN